MFGQAILPGLPNITGTFGATIAVDNTTTGAMILEGKSASSWWQGSVSVDRSGRYSFDASRSSSVYKDNFTTVQPYSIFICFIIKY